MNRLTFRQKQDYYDKVRRSNDLASLRLAGFDTSRADADKPAPSRESVIEKYRQNPRQGCPKAQLVARILGK